MNILLVCAGGMSTSILMKKMETYWKEHGQELNIKAVGLSEYQDVYQDFDIVMMGPQVSYRLKEVKENTGLPTEAIQSFDYAVANCDNIMKLANKLYAQK
ncbi:PTS sugar transporter subunit IIB [Erysipelothrix sp. HDW6A]|uniref:PTS sugar transporter subunit IIB n=1 Tax=Erysipelothrix sp. HDW6A TaxID=2714928 RepID=UPI00140C9AD6|nr:PTS sugar transporter subunit IIB [Erysipelothrix sp. HDW6A]QIK57932.1 PTS sugar transporter subunit IIB [Erysipelothrix sp. HDW6A]